MSEPVELHPAYRWDCPDCGIENFTRAIVGEWDEETEREMREEHGILPYEQGEWITCPNSVRCHACGGEFETAREEPDETDE